MFGKNKNYLINKFKKSALITGAILACAMSIFIFYKSIITLAADTPALSKDALAMRISKNPNHYSPTRWYYDQGFTGTPQPIMIDGYDAVKDGRSIYINAANVDNTGTFYTNIYILSYSQNPDAKTMGVLEQIAKNIRFNTNKKDPGTCSISGIFSSSSGTCAKGYTASGNKCYLAANKNCYADSDCPAGLFCSSEKAKIVRDTKRLSDLAEIKIALESYNNKNNSYPKLSSGSYIQNHSISSWPSWSANLAKELAVPLPVDPINKIGYCGEGNFEKSTCWDEKTKAFSGSLASGKIALSNGSYIYGYSYSADTSYNLCAKLESGYATGYNSCEAVAGF